MFDFLRNLTKSAEEKRQEAVAAYLDEALTGSARQQFEQELAQDEALRQEVEQLRLIKQSLRRLPQREVPRNFILDPAQYGRPARQPWVQAYPILRVATAMTAFFLIFAFAAGVFTGLGGAEPAALAPAADVAQLESVEVTRVVVETAESLAYEAEGAPAEPEAAEEAMMEESADAEIAAADEAAEEEMAVAEEAAPPEATAVPGPLDSFEEEPAEDGTMGSEPVVQPTPTLSATPTVSTLPRVTPPTPLPERGLDEVAGNEAADAAVAEVPETEDDTAAAETTAVLPQEEVPGVANIEPFDPLVVLQLGLAALLLLLAGLTLYARRQR